MAIEGIDIPTLLAELDRRGREDAAAFRAARVIRAQEATLFFVESEIIQAEFRVLAHAVEIDRMKDHRRAFDERRLAKAGRRC